MSGDRGVEARVGPGTEWFPGSSRAATSFALPAWTSPAGSVHAATPRWGPGQEPPYPDMSPWPGSAAAAPAGRPGAGRRPRRPGRFAVHHMTVMASLPRAGPAAYEVVADRGARPRAWGRPPPDVATRGRVSAFTPAYAGQDGGGVGSPPGGSRRYQPPPRQSRTAECVGDRVRSEPDQQGGLEDERHPLHERTGAGIDASPRSWRST